MGPVIVRIAVPGPPGGASFEVSVEVVFVNAPALGPVTLTEMVHEALPAKEPFASAMLVEPAVAPVKVPPHPLLTPLGGVATAIPAGNASVKAIPVNGVKFGLLRVMVRVAVPFGRMGLGLNAFVTVGA